MVKLSYVPTTGYKSVRDDSLALAKGDYLLIPKSASEKSKTKGMASVRVQILNVDQTSVTGVDHTWLDATILPFQKEGDGVVFRETYIGTFVPEQGFAKIS